MGDVLSPFTISPPPPPSPSSSKNSIPMLYYGLVVMGTAAIVLAIYNLIIIKGCNFRRHTQSEEPNNHLVEVVVNESRRRFENSQRNLLSSFKYKKEVVAIKEGEEVQQQQGDGDEYECPVCLSIYEEGEEVTKLPRCNHSFHALCIDMWLYSHFDCPICRTPVGPFFHPFPAENSQWWVDGIFVWVQKCVGHVASIGCDINKWTPTSTPPHLVLYSLISFGLVLRVNFNEDFLVIVHCRYLI